MDKKLYERLLHSPSIRQMMSNGPEVSSSNSKSFKVFTRKGYISCKGKARTMQKMKFLRVFQLWVQ